MHNIGANRGTATASESANLERVPERFAGMVLGRAESTAILEFAALFSDVAGASFADLTGC